MKSCISMWSFEELFSAGKMSLEGSFEYAASRGIDGVEVLDYYLKDDAGYAMAAKASERLGIEIPCMTILCDLSVGAAAFESQRPYILAMMARAHSLGARYLRILGGEDAEGAGHAEAFARIRKNALSLVGPAEDKRMVMVFENTGACLSHAADLAEAVRSVGSPSLRANFDTANPLLVGEGPAAALETLAGLVSYVHFKDFRRADGGEKRCQNGLGGQKFIGCPSGSGLVDFGAVVAILRRTGYDGHLSLEYEGPAEDTAPLDVSVKHLLAFT